MADLYEILENNMVISSIPNEVNESETTSGLPEEIKVAVNMTFDVDIPVNFFKYDFAPLNFITKVIQQDKYTIIIDYFGKKSVVKARGEAFDKEKGLMVCLLKFLSTPKGYSNIMSLYSDDPILEKAAVKGALVSHIGSKDLNKFIKEFGE